MVRAVTQPMHSGGKRKMGAREMADDQNTPYPTGSASRPEAEPDRTGPMSRGDAEPGRTPLTSRGGPEADEILLEVCVECGKEYMSESRMASGLLRCERCGGEVFRSFDAPTSEDEAEADFRESTDRDTTPEDGPTEITRGDLADLGNL